MNSAKSKQIPFGLRLPDAMRGRLKMLAAQNRRSMNAELLIHIEAGLEKSESRGLALHDREVEHA